MNYSAIIWDWNGTIFDDLDLCYRIYSRLAIIFDFDELSIQEYRRLYRFPLDQFFYDRGFRGDINRLALEYRKIYTKGVNKCRIHPGARKLLREFTARGIPQHVVSAHNHNDLQYMIERYKLRRHFSSVNGLSGIEGGSKQKLAVSVLERENLPGSSVLFIGDTDHDYDVALSVSAESWLVAEGHSAIERLALCDNARVFPSMSSIVAEYGLGAK